MPKTRKRVLQAGAKSVPVRIKHKLGGRKSTKGAKQMSAKELSKFVERGNKKDSVKAAKELMSRYPDSWFMLHCFGG